MDSEEFVYLRLKPITSKRNVLAGARYTPIGARSRKRRTRRFMFVRVRPNFMTLSEKMKNFAIKGFREILSFHTKNLSLHNVLN